MKKNVFYAIALLLFGFALPALASGGHDGETASITHKMMILMMQLGVIIFAAKLGGMLFQRLKMPVVLGELFSGMLIGPYLLGGIALPSMPFGLFLIENGFPISVELYGICSFAAILLLFLVGLETDLKLFLRYSLAGSAVGIGGVLVSFVIGDLTMVLFGSKLIGKELGFFDAPCLFLGVLSTATSVGITARVLSEKRKLDSPEGVTILAGAVIDDVLGIILLAIVLGMIEASKATGIVDWGAVGGIAAKAIGIWLTSTVLGLLLAHRISTLLKWFRDKTSIAILALGLALILAGLFEEAKLAMIIGAYVAGLSLSQTDISRVVQEKLDGAQRLLVPIFFCCMGMMVNFSDFASLDVVIFGLIYSVLAIIAKVVGCSIPSFFFNFNFRGAMRVGMGMVPRGEVALIVAGIGLASGVIDGKVFGVAIMMTVISTVVAPVLLVLLFKNPARGTRNEVARGEKTSLEFNFPSYEIAELMRRKLLDAFEMDEFFVHNLEHEEKDLYQLRKDDMIIELREVKKDLVFSCSQQDVQMVNAAVFEVMGELRQMLEGLNKPFDKQNLVRNHVQQPQKAETKSIKRKIHLQNFINSSCIAPELKGESKEEVIAELIALLAANHPIENPDAVLQQVMEREKSMSTGLQNGIAIPHAKTDAIKKIVCAVGIKREGIFFDSLDGKPSNIFVLELAPNNAAGPHLQLMSTLSQILENRSDELLKNKLSSEEVFDLLIS